MRSRALLLALAVSFGGPGPTGAVGTDPIELRVFAASSLREAFTEIAALFEKENADARVVLNLAGSAELASQILNGAQADVFASADAGNLDKVAAAGLARPARIFARNAPVVVVSRDAAATVRTFADLPRADRIVLGAAEVPIGRYSREILDRAARRYGPDFRRRVEQRVVSNELNVRQVLAKVTLGEADAAIVYRTDAATADDRVRVVEIPAELGVVAEYPIAVLVAAPQPTLAEAWVALVLSARGQRALTERGFLPAPRADGAEP
jgi:molybdate transport system substrate-binding protein